MEAVGITMNMVVLFSLILALGMLVDNAIVAVENTYRYVQEGWDRRSAAKYAVGEIAMPIIASTATTLAAFLPMVFWPGIVGEFMKYLPITLIITLSASLFVALVIVPSLCGQFLELEGAPRRPLTRTARWLLVGGAGLALLAVLATNWLTALLMALTARGLYLFHTRVGVPVTRWFMDVGLTRLIADYERQLCTYAHILEKRHNRHVDRLLLYWNACRLNVGRRGADAGTACSRTGRASAVNGRSRVFPAGRPAAWARSCGYPRTPVDCRP